MDLRRSESSMVYRAIELTKLQFYELIESLIQKDFQPTNSDYSTWYVYNGEIFKLIFKNGHWKLIYK